MFVQMSHNDRLVESISRYNCKTSSTYNQSTEKMPLVKIFAKHTLQKPIPLAALQSKMCDIWGTKPNTTKLMLQRVEDWTDAVAEDVYGTSRNLLCASL